MTNETKIFQEIKGNIAMLKIPNKKSLRFLNNYIGKLAERGKAKIMIDLSLVDILDDWTFAGIITAHDICAKLKSKLVLLNPTKSVEKQIESSGYSRILNVEYA